MKQEQAAALAHNKFTIAVREAKSRALTDFMMGLLEDMPEFVIDVIFLVRAARGDIEGEDELTNADVSLFVISGVITIFHVVKCFWTFFKILQLVRAVGRVTASTERGAGEADLEAGAGFGFGSM